MTKNSSNSDAKYNLAWKIYLYGKLALLRGVIGKKRLLRGNYQIGVVNWWQSILVASLLMTGIIVGARQLGSLQFLELMAFDRAVRLQPDKGPDKRLLIVSIGEEDLQAQNQWPISDKTLAEVLEKLQKYQPKVIGLDLYRNLPQPPGQADLIKQLKAKNIIAITKLDDEYHQGVPTLATIPKDRIGFNDFVIDTDGVIRRNFIYASQGEKKFYSFSLRLILSYLADKNNTFQVKNDRLIVGKTPFLAITNNSGGYENIDSAGYQVILTYRSPEKVAPEISLTEVLNGKIKPDLIKDKIVLIGTTAPSLKDLFFTPYSGAEQKNIGKLPGVIIHAQITSQMLSTILDNQPLLGFLPEWAETIWILLWAIGGGMLAWRFSHPLVLGFFGITASGTLWGIYLVSFSQFMWIPVISPNLALVTTGALVLAYKLFYNNLHDDLTGLPNRNLFLRRLEIAINNAKQGKSTLFAVLFLNIDRFKNAIDNYGIQVTDKLLINAAQRLKHSLKNTDIIARVGGDEFAILLEDINDVRMATHVADELQKQIALPFKIKDQEIFINASIGIAINREEYDYQPGDLLRDAHTAMYRAKNFGKARYEVFATGMRQQIVKRLQVETDLHRAIEKQEFRLYYQPIVSLENGKITGFEALARWQHPIHGLISPAEFIPVAEETGLIIPLGEWIFQEACRQLQIWQQELKMQQSLTISVNFSGQQFYQPNLVETIEHIMQLTGVNGQNIKLEITESVAMKDVESIINLLVRLKALNLQLSIDDFGTGYSSLSYLHRFPVDTLKIDRSFVSHIEDAGDNAAIVQTIIILSHSLGMDVIAEGVETAGQLAVLQSLKCEYGQGYFFSKPLESSAATALLLTNLNLFQES